jgi:hypothetical protein
MSIKNNMQQTAFSLLSKLAPGMAGKIIFKSSFKTKRYPLPIKEMELAKKATHKQLTAKGKETIQIYEWGSGPIALLVHGWNGRGTQFHSVVDWLVAAGYKAVAFDAPGHGLSSGLESDIPSFARAILAIGIEYGVVDLAISHSAGGLALGKAIEDGFKSANVALICPPESLKSALNSILDGFSLAEPARIVYLKLCEGRLGAGVWEKFDFSRFGGHLSGLNNVIVVHDTDDREVPWKEGEAVSRYIDGAQLFSTHGLGHRRLLRSEALLELFTPHLTKNLIQDAI